MTMSDGLQLSKVMIRNLVRFFEYALKLHNFNRQLFDY
jgi:hypothetical protein